MPDEGVSGDSSWESFECQDVLIKTKNVILMVTGRKVRGLPNSEELILWMLLISHQKCIETADSCERISDQSSRPIGRHRHYVAFMGKNDIFSLAYAWMYIKRIELKFFFPIFTFFSAAVCTALVYILKGASKILFSVLLLCCFNLKFS